MQHSKTYIAIQYAHWRCWIQPWNIWRTNNSNSSSCLQGNNNGESTGRSNAQEWESVLGVKLLRFASWQCSRQVSQYELKGSNCNWTKLQRQTLQTNRTWHSQLKSLEKHRKHVQNTNSMYEGNFQRRIGHIVRWVLPAEAQMPFLLKDMKKQGQILAKHASLPSNRTTSHSLYRGGPCYPTNKV